MKLWDLGHQLSDFSRYFIYYRWLFVEFFELVDGALLFVEVGGFVSDGFEGLDAEGQVSGFGFPVLAFGA